MSAVGRKRIRLPARLAESTSPEPKKKLVMANTSADSGDSATSAHDRNAKEIDELQREIDQLAAQMSAVTDALHVLIGKIDKNSSLGGRSCVSSQADALAPLNRTQSWVQSLPESKAMANFNAY